MDFKLQIKEYYTSYNNYKADNTLVEYDNRK